MSAPNRDDELNSLREAKSARDQAAADKAQALYEVHRVKGEAMFAAGATADMLITDAARLPLHDVWRERISKAESDLDLAEAMDEAAQSLLMEAATHFVGLAEELAAAEAIEFVRDVALRGYLPTSWPPLPLPVSDDRRCPLPALTVEHLRQFAAHQPDELTRSGVLHLASMLEEYGIEHLGELVSP